MIQKKRLSEMDPGKVVRILSLEEHPAATRLLAMGIRPGAWIRITRFASFGQTLYLESGAQQFGIRRTEAANIWVECEK